MEKFEHLHLTSRCRYFLRIDTGLGHTHMQLAQAYERAMHGGE